MARVLLIVPHLPQRLGSPYLGQQYVAASLLRAGHEVVCLDMAALAFDGDDGDALALASAFVPDIIGMTLFTTNAARGYGLARALRGAGRLLVAGGPHPTVCPQEPLEHGFDLVVAGEGELVMESVAAAVDAGSSPPDLPGLRRPGRPYEPPVTLVDLDALPFPSESRGVYAGQMYGPHGSGATLGMITSRGCPAKCTFCSNAVTGRQFRWRSSGNVVSEMLALHRAEGLSHFAFWDDAFTANRGRLKALCHAIIDQPALRGVTWTCITPGNMVKPRDLALMARAGCVAINFGLESGDLGVLKAINKGQRPEQVIAAVKAAKAEGMTTVVNFMFGFPEEGPEQLRRTLELMHRLSDNVDVFNNRGVLVPFPGTQIYARWHHHYGFTDWWLDPAKIIDEPDPRTLGAIEALELLESDPTLELDFFRYSDEVREVIAQCVRFKARHNLARISAMGAVC